MRPARCRLSGACNRSCCRRRLGRLRYSILRRRLLDVNPRGTLRRCWHCCTSERRSHRVHGIKVHSRHCAAPDSTDFRQRRFSTQISTQTGNETESGRRICWSGPPTEMAVRSVLPPFQAGHAGSIPVARSTKFPLYDNFSIYCSFNCRRLKILSGSAFRDGRPWPRMRSVADSAPASGLGSRSKVRWAAALLVVRASWPALPAVSSRG